MVQYSQVRFDASFAALSDATRRGVLEQLGGANASITDLAEKFHMTLTGMKKHVGILERAGLVTNRTTVERESERELVVTRTFNSPARIVFEAWTKPELLKRWWAPKSFGVSFISCEADVRAGGAYRFVFGHPASEQPMEFFGRYIEVTPHSRLVWTNDEGGEGGAVTTVTFEERGAQTLMVMHDLYPSKEALDAAIASGSTSGVGETFEQLDEFLVTLGASVGRS